MIKCKYHIDNNDRFGQKGDQADDAGKKQQDSFVYL